MKVYRLSKREDAEKTYPCVESASTAWASGLPLARAWFAANLGKYVEGFHLEDDGGQVIGHIYWSPSERALVPYRIEESVAFLYCEWVQRQLQGRGYLQIFFEAFVDFLRADGYKGILVNSTGMETCMHYRHFAKRGFQALHEVKGGKLMYLPLTQPTVHVELLPPQVIATGTAPVEVVIVGSLFCPVMASAVLAMRKVAREVGDQVAVREMPAGTEGLARYGVADGILVNGKIKFSGPVTEDQVRTAIRQELGDNE